MGQPAITKVHLEKWPLKRSVCVCNVAKNGQAMSPGLLQWVLLVSLASAGFPLFFNIDFPWPKNENPWPIGTKYISK